MSTKIIKDFGIIINNLDLSAANCQLVTNLNKLIDTHYEYCPLIFCHSMAPMTLPSKCCHLSHQHAWEFGGVLFSTNIYTTNILSHCIKSQHKLFYVYDLEWLYHPQISYTQLRHIYQNPNIKLIARSESHFKVLKNNWQEPIGIINNYNYKDIVEIVNAIQ